MHENDTVIEKAVLAGVHTGRPDVSGDVTEESMDELEQLAKTAGVDVCGMLLQNRRTPDPATYVGEGKIDEIRNAAASLDANVVIFDDELSPVQVKNISEALGLKVVDRTTLILDIFASRAATREGKIQVEMAQLRYLLPRLTGMGSSLSRLGGGIGTRGPGETKLETDRRHIRRRIDALADELKEIQRHRDLLRARRKKEAIPVVALVGYTNAGKSSLLNILTGANVLAQDKLFATLDPTHRGITLADGRELLMVDTVGFIRKLPTHLIRAFKSTLEEAALADVLLHVIDASNPEHNHHIKVVEDILDEIGAGGKPCIAVFNKMDAAQDVVPAQMSANVHACAYISAKNGDGTDRLMDLVSQLTPGSRQRIRACIPYSEGRLMSLLHETQVVQDEAFGQDGVTVSALVDAAMYDALRQYLIT